MVIDTQQRPLANLRLSVTDRCNLRCQYCMPEQDYVWLPREDILQFEEMERLVDVFLELGVRKVRLTGGEPLLRKDVAGLVEQLANKSRIDDLALTTNGVLLAASPWLFGFAEEISAPHLGLGLFEIVVTASSQTTPAHAADPAPAPPSSADD